MFVYLKKDIKLKKFEFKKNLVINNYCHYKK